MKEFPPKWLKPMIVGLGLTMVLEAIGFFSWINQEFQTFYLIGVLVGWVSSLIVFLWLDKK